MTRFQALLHDLDVLEKYLKGQDDPNWVTVQQAVRLLMYLERVHQTMNGVDDWTRYER